MEEPVALADTIENASLPEAVKAEETTSKEIQPENVGVKEIEKPVAINETPVESSTKETIEETAKVPTEVVGEAVEESTEEASQAEEAVEVPANFKESVLSHDETSAPIEPWAQKEEIPVPGSTEAPKEEHETTGLTSEILGAGAAAGAVLAGAAAVASHQKSEAAGVPGDHKNQQTTSADDIQTQSRAAADAQSTDGKPAPFYFSQQPSAMSFETDPALAALAGDREALLNKLNQPSTDQLAMFVNEPTTPAPESQTAESSKTTEPSKAAEPAKADKTPDNLAPKNNDEDARPPSQNRSVTAVSLNGATDNWLKAIMRTVFGGFFGAIFAPFRRGKKAAK